jgi:hypothetical protein
MVTDLLLSVDQRFYKEVCLTETREPFQLSFAKTTLYSKRQPRNAVWSHSKGNLEFHLQNIYGLLVTKLLCLDLREPIFTINLSSIPCVFFRTNREILMNQHINQLALR